MDKILKNGYWFWSITKYKICKNDMVCIPNQNTYGIPLSTILANFVGSVLKHSLNRCMSDFAYASSKFPVLFGTLDIPRTLYTIGFGTSETKRY